RPVAGWRFPARFAGAGPGLPGFSELRSPAQLVAGGDMNPAGLCSVWAFLGMWSVPPVRGSTPLHEIGLMAMRRAWAVKVCCIKGAGHGTGHRQVVQR